MFPCRARRRLGNMSKEGREGRRRHRHWSALERRSRREDRGDERRETRGERREARGERREARDQLTHVVPMPMLMLMLVMLMPMMPSPPVRGRGIHQILLAPPSLESDPSSRLDDIWTRAELETTSSGCRRGSQKPVQL